LAGVRQAASPAEIEAARKQLDEILFRLAIAKKVIPNRTAGIARDLLPDTDLLASGDIQYFEQTLAAGWNNPTYSGTNPDDKVWGIYGVKNDNASPRTTAIRFWDETARTALKDIWMVQGAWLEENTILISENPLVWEPSRGFNIDQYARAAGTDNVIFLGRVVEPKGKTIVGEKEQSL
jgi:hypothetical protein